MSLFCFAECSINSSVAKFSTKLSTFFSQKHALGSLGKLYLFPNVFAYGKVAVGWKTKYLFFYLDLSSRRAQDD